MSSVLDSIHGSVVVVRPPVPVTINKAGANYKSEVGHLEYSPRAAFDEWLAICNAILACGGDALFQFEDGDERYLDHRVLRVDSAGDIRPHGSDTVLGNIDDVDTGRVFAANGPWVGVFGDTLRAVMPNMLDHRRREGPYFRDLLGQVADAGGYSVDVSENPHRWEGMADVAAVGDRVILTYAVPGHYDEGLSPKSSRSSRDGVTFAADEMGVPADARIYAELVYPHFHGDTVHFSLRPPAGAPRLVHFPGGLWGDGAERVRAALADAIIPISRYDAADAYASNSRQIDGGLLMAAGASNELEGVITELGLAVHRLPLYELFGKAGGGPACATLYLPENLRVPESFPLRFSRQQEAVRRHRERVPEHVIVDAGFFEGRQRG